MNGNILITGAQMVLPSGIKTGDLRITDGVISEITTDSKLEPKDGEQVHDATGLHLLPGIIDPQVHFRDPGQPEKEDLHTGSRAAASGGVTSFLDMPNNVPSQTTLQSMYEKLETASNRCSIVPTLASSVQSVNGLLVPFQRTSALSANELSIHFTNSLNDSSAIDLSA